LAGERNGVFGLGTLRITFAAFLRAPFPVVGSFGRVRWRVVCIGGCGERVFPALAGERWDWGEGRLAAERVGETVGMECDPRVCGPASVSDRSGDAMGSGSMTAEERSFCGHWRG
jgi:hypothetical protein